MVHESVTVVQWSQTARECQPRHPAASGGEDLLTEIRLVGATLQPHAFLRALDQEVAN